MDAISLLSFPVVMLLTLSPSQGVPLPRIHNSIVFPTIAEPLVINGRFFKKIGFPFGDILILSTGPADPPATRGYQDKILFGQPGERNRNHFGYIRRFPPGQRSKVELRITNPSPVPPCVEDTNETTFTTDEKSFVSTKATTDSGNHGNQDQVLDRLVFPEENGDITFLSLFRTPDVDGVSPCPGNWRRDHHGNCKQPIRRIRHQVIQDGP